MCVWEDILPRLCDEESIFAVKQDEVGICELRDIALNVIAPAVDVAYEEVGDDYDLPFDWEFVPAFIELVTPILNSSNPWIIGDDQAKAIGKQILCGNSK